MKKNNNNLIGYIGTYTGNEGKGIYVYNINFENGKFELIDVYTEIDNPSYLTINSEKNRLYAVSELTEFQGEKTGLVASFSIADKTGKLKFLNKKITGGGAPCYLSLDQNNEYLFVSNYVGGSITVFPLTQEGEIKNSVFFRQHSGSSVNSSRQKNPHPHSIRTDPTNNYVVVPDLGIDKLMIYKINKSRQGQLLNKSSEAKIAPGAGPRHIVFHPDQDYAYLINELDSSISVLKYQNQGKMEEIQKVSCLPDEFNGSNTSADIHVHPSGNFLYGSNRGHDSIVIYKIDKSSGKLTYLNHESTRGQVPRNFVLDPSGEFLLAANQETNSLTLFNINQKTGELSFTGTQIKVPEPVCIKLLSR
ncbi:MAG: lactonase family protein [bacterium]